MDAQAEHFFSQTRLVVAQVSLKAHSLGVFAGVTGIILIRCIVHFSGLPAAQVAVLVFRVAAEPLPFQLLVFLSAVGRVCLVWGLDFPVQPDPARC